MGATTKSITGLFAKVCGRNTCDRGVREQIVGQGTRLAAALRYPSPVHALRHSSRQQRLDRAIDQARWLLERWAPTQWVGGHLKSAALGVLDSIDVGTPESGVVSSPTQAAGRASHTTRSEIVTLGFEG